MRRNRGEYMKNLKKLTILHSNDMHGDFLAEQIDERLVGGVSLLSGYVNKVRREEKNVIYAIAGDMFRGSVIDSEYKGTSTSGIMSLMGPDVATIGNHEVDYGLAHLLFLEKCADFPIINANLHIKSNGRRMFRPFWIAHIYPVTPPPTNTNAEHTRRARWATSATPTTPSTSTSPCCSPTSALRRTRSSPRCLTPTGAWTSSSADTATQN